jgi:hypothetical protein
MTKSMQNFSVRRMCILIRRFKYVEITSEGEYFFGINDFKEGADYIASCMGCSEIFAEMIIAAMRMWCDENGHELSIER